MGSNYSAVIEDSDTAISETEVMCHRCKGTGEDRDGADCLNCDGYGTLLI